MEIVTGTHREEKITRPTPDIDQYREAIRDLINTEVRKALEQEVQKAAQELIEEQRKAIKQILDEHKLAIRQVVEEEKKAIWEKADALRRSIIRLGI